MRKHTPGPWILSADQPTRVESSVDGSFVADCYGLLDEPCDEANARLIASAPDLYEAAKQLKDVCNRPSAARTRAEAWAALDKAIAKAEGRE